MKLVRLTRKTNRCHQNFALRLLFKHSLPIFIGLILVSTTCILWQGHQQYTRAQRGMLLIESRSYDAATEELTASLEEAKRFAFIKAMFFGDASQELEADTLYLRAYAMSYAMTESPESRDRVIADLESALRINPGNDLLARFKHVDALTLERLQAKSMSYKYLLELASDSRPSASHSSVTSASTLELEPEPASKCTLNHSMDLIRTNSLGFSSLERFLQEEPFNYGQTYLCPNGMALLVFVDRPFGHFIGETEKVAVVLLSAHSIAINQVASNVSSLEIRTMALNSWNDNSYIAAARLRLQNFSATKTTATVLRVFINSENHALSLELPFSLEHESLLVDQPLVPPAIWPVRDLPFILLAISALTGFLCLPMLAIRILAESRPRKLRVEEVIDRLLETAAVQKLGPKQLEQLRIIVARALGVTTLEPSAMEAKFADHRELLSAALRISEGVEALASDWDETKQERVAELRTTIRQLLLRLP